MKATLRIFVGDDANGAIAASVAHHVRHRVHRDFDADEAPAARDLDVIGMPPDARAHLLQHAEKTEVALHRARGQALDSHRAADQRRRRSEVAGIRRVRLDDETLCPIPLAARHYDHVVFDAAMRSPRLHQPERHVDEGPRGVADHAQLEAGFPNRRRHQHRRDELRRRARIDRSLAAFEPRARRIDDHRRTVVVALAVHARAEPLHRVELRPDRTLAHPLIAVDTKAALAERDHRDDEAHHGAGAADKDLAATRRNRAAAPADRDPARGLVDLDGEAHHPQRVAHVARVVAQQHRVEHRAPLRQRRQHHRAIRDALGARQHHARVERSGQRSYFNLAFQVSVPD